MELNVTAFLASMNTIYFWLGLEFCVLFLLLGSPVWGVECVEIDQPTISDCQRMPSCSSFLEKLTTQLIA